MGKDNEQQHLELGWPPAPPPRRRARPWPTCAQLSQLALPAVLAVELATLGGLAFARALDGSIHMAERNAVLCLCAAYGAWSIGAWLVGATGALATDRAMASRPGIWLPLLPVVCVLGPALCSPLAREGLLAIARGSHAAWLVGMQGARASSLALILRWRSGDFSHLLASRFALFDFTYGASACVLLAVMALPAAGLPRRLLAVWHALGLCAAGGVRAVGDDWAYEATFLQMAAEQERPSLSQCRSVASPALSASAADMYAMFRDLSLDSVPSRHERWSELTASSHGSAEARTSGRHAERRLDEAALELTVPSSAFVSTRSALHSPLLLGVAALLPLLVGLNALAAAVYLVDGERTRAHAPYAHGSHALEDLSGTFAAG